MKLKQILTESLIDEGLFSGFSTQKPKQAERPTNIQKGRAPDKKKGPSIMMPQQEQLMKMAATSLEKIPNELTAYQDFIAKCNQAFGPDNVKGNMSYYIKMFDIAQVSSGQRQR